MPRKQIAFYLEEETKTRLDRYKNVLGVSLQSLLAALIEEVLAEPEALALVASNSMLAASTPKKTADATPASVLALVASKGASINDSTPASTDASTPELESVKLLRQLKEKGGVQ